MSDVLRYLQSKGVQYRESGDEAIMNCPACGDTERKFGVNILSGAYNCLHLKRCGIAGGFHDLQKLFGDNPVRKAFSPLVKPTAKKYVKPIVEIFPVTAPVAAYLDKRRLTAETRDFFRVGAEDDDTVMLPFYKNGVLVNVKYRSITDKKKMRTAKNAEPTLFGRDLITGNSLIICEGEYDAMALHRYGKQAVSVPMGAGNLQWIDTEWEFLERFKEIYLCFDMDDPGRDAAVQIADRLGKWRCKIVSLPFKDANECLVKEATIAEHFESASYDAPPMLTTPTAFLERIMVNRNAGPERLGVPTAWRCLTDKLGGWRPGEVTVWSGRNGAGKSTVLSQSIVDLAGKGVKSCIYSGEMLPEDYLEWAVAQHTKNGNPSDFMFTKSIEWMEGKIYVLDTIKNLTPKELFDNFEYAARRYGVTHFVIDSLMKIRLSGQDENRAQCDFLNEMTLFAQKLRVHVHLVAHPRKTENDNDLLGKVDIKGSSGITDFANNVIFMSRVSETDKESMMEKGLRSPDAFMRLSKNRKRGIESSGMPMYFDIDTKIFTEKEQVR